jgi:hypothetical protein
MDSRSWASASVTLDSIAQGQNLALPPNSDFSDRLQRGSACAAIATMRSPAAAYRNFVARP